MSAPAYLDPSRPVAERVEAILALMTDEQKLACLNGVPETVLADGRTLPALTNAFNEVLHSSGKKPDATFFPQAIGLGATWNTELIEAVGAAVAHEVRARDTDVFASFGPVADIRSNPLAGRFEEGFGEDPLHVGAMTTAYAWGLRGRHPDYVKTFTQMKHFLGYSHEWHRAQGSASMSVRALHEYQVVPYRMPVEAGAVMGAMTAYNNVNGVPSIISPLLETLRSEWTDDGVFFFLPDGWDGVNLHTTKGEPWDTWQVDPRGDVPYPQGLAAEAGHAIEGIDEIGVYASALMLHAGVSHFHDGSELPFVPNAGEAVRRGLLGVTMSHVDRSVRDWLHFLVRTGTLDGDACEYNRIPADPHPQDRPEHIALAHRAAQEQLVLLKNTDAALPLPPTASIAVLGPLADLNLRDFYSPTVPTAQRPTPLQALRERFNSVTHHSGNDTLAWQAGGRYVNVADNGALVARADTLGDTETFEAWDWAHEQHMFRHNATGTFLQANLLQRNDGPASFENQAGASGDSGPLLLALKTEMEDGDAWFTHQNLHYRPAGDSAVQGAVELFGVNHIPAEADGPYHVRLAADGSLPLTKGPADPILTETIIENGPEAAAAIAAEADWAVVLVGNHPLVNARECFDRPGLDLAPRQADLVRDVAAAKPGRTIVVVVSAYPLAIGDIAADPNVAAILYTSHAGQAAGAALAEALAGDCSPAGRLTSTWLADTSSLPKAGPRAEAFRVSDVDMLEYDVISAGLTYRYSKAAPVYPFGHGLSYTTVEYGAVEAPAEASADAPFTVAFDLANTGERTSDEVALVYASSLDSAYDDQVGNARLAGFTRVKDLAPGETRRVRIEVDPRDLFVWDVVSGKRIVETGRYTLTVGGASAEVRIQGEAVGDLDLSATANVWEKATIARGLTYWEVAKLHTLAREGGYHSTGSRRAGSHVGFRNVVLDGAARIELRAATTGADWADLADPVIEVRAAAPDGPLLAEVEVPKTGHLQAFTDVTADLTGAAGVHDLYLVFRSGGIYLDTVRLAR